MSIIFPKPPHPQKRSVSVCRAGESEKKKNSSEINYESYEVLGVENEYDDISDKLISFGANENIRNNDGKTPWEYYNSTVISKNKNIN